MGSDGQANFVKELQRATTTLGELVRAMSSMSRRGSLVQPAIDEEPDNPLDVDMPRPDVVSVAGPDDGEDWTDPAKDTGGNAAAGSIAGVSKPAPQEKITIEVIPDPITHQPTILIRTSPIDPDQSSITDQPPPARSSSKPASAMAPEPSIAPTASTAPATVPAPAPGIAAADAAQPPPPPPGADVPSTTSSHTDPDTPPLLSQPTLADGYTIDIIADPHTHRPTIVIRPAGPDDAAGTSGVSLSHVLAAGPDGNDLKNLEAKWRRDLRRFIESQEGADLDDYDDNDDSEDDDAPWIPIHPHLGRVVVRLLEMLGTSREEAYGRAVKWGLYEAP
jgi:hypothetical protein